MMDEVIPSRDWNEQRMVCGLHACPQRDFCLLSAFIDWRREGIAPQPDECPADALYSAWLEGAWLGCNVEECLSFQSPREAAAWQRQQLEPQRSGQADQSQG